MERRESACRGMACRTLSVQSPHARRGNGKPYLPVQSPHARRGYGKPYPYNQGWGAVGHGEELSATGCSAWSTSGRNGMGGCEHVKGRPACSLWNSPSQPQHQLIDAFAQVAQVGLVAGFQFGGCVAGVTDVRKRLAHGGPIDIPVA